MLHLTTIKNESVKNKNNLTFSHLETGSFFYYDTHLKSRRPGVMVKISNLTAFCLTYNKKVITRLDMPVILIDDLVIKSV